MKRFLERLGFHTVHYWGVPHPRESDGRMVMTCYECHSEKLVAVELRTNLEAK